MERQFIRAFAQRAAEGKAGDPIRFIASTEGIKRDGMDLRAGDWYLDNFRKNPVFLWAHDYWGQKLPLGRVEAAVEGSQLMADVWFDQEDEFACSVESKYRRGFLHTVSVGWDFIEIDNRRVMDLLDVSGVPVPGDPDALVVRQYQALKEIVEGDGVGTNGEDEWERTAAAMAEVFSQASEETEEVRKRRYNSLLPAYRRLGKTAPEWIGQKELRALSAEQLAGLMLEGEDIYLRPTMARTGAVLSKANRDDLETAIGMLDSLGQTLRGILARAEKEPAEEPAEVSEEDPDETESERLGGIGALLRTIDIQTQLLGKGN